VVAGTNTNEGTLFVYPSNLAPMTEATFERSVKGFLGGDTNAGHQNPPPNATTMAEINALYPSKSPGGILGDNRPVLADLMGDGTFICGSQYFLKYVARTGAPTYAYHFDFLRRKACRWPGTDSWGVTHAAELPFVFDDGAPLAQMSGTGTGACTDGEGFNVTGAAVGWAMRTEWGAIAANGAPTPAWPRWTEATALGAKFGGAAAAEDAEDAEDAAGGGGAVGGAAGIVRRAATPMTVEAHRRKQFCAWWDRHYADVASRM